MADEPLDLTGLKIPQHVAIIMDCNGRWAKQRGLPRHAGHRAGAENLRRVINACVEFGIKYLTIYAFSTENWGRPETEVKALMRIFARVLDQEVELVFAGQDREHVLESEPRRLDRLELGNSFGRYPSLFIGLARG